MFFLAHRTFFTMLLLLCCNEQTNLEKWQSTIVNEAGVTSLTLSEDGSTFATSSSSGLKTWSTKTLKPLLVTELPAEKVRFTRSGDLWARRTTGKNLSFILTDTKTRKEIWNIQDASPRSLMPILSSCGTYVVSVTRTGQVSCWRKKDGKVVLEKRFDLEKEFLNLTLGRTGVHSFVISKDRESIGIAYLRPDIYAAKTKDEKWVTRVFSISSGKEERANDGLIPRKINADRWTSNAQIGSLSMTAITDLNEMRFSYLNNGKEDNHWCVVSMLSSNQRVAVTLTEKNEAFLWKQQTIKGAKTASDKSKR